MKKISVKKFLISFVAASTLLLVIIIAVQPNEQKKTDKEKRESDHQLLVDKVQKEIDALDSETNKTMASTSQSGYQGEIVSAEKAIGEGSVKIKVTTHFNNSGREDEGGQNIAYKVFGIICHQVPELKSLYVIGSSGLESKSVYRSDIPGCKITE